MSSKDKEMGKSKLKNFLKQTKSGGTGESREKTIRMEIEKELRPEQPAAQRCKALKDWADVLLPTSKLEETTITCFLELTKDLIVANKPAEYRQTALSFYKKLIFTQYKNLNLIREKFFNLIQSHEVPEDLQHYLDLLDTLTEHGRHINNFEERIGKFMLHWLPAIEEAKLLRPYLDILINLIKYNAAHLENEIVVGIVQNACNLSCTVVEDEIGLQCLKILEMVMGYTIFPSEPLPICVVTLCRTVNHVPYCQDSYKIMKNLLGTQLGYHSMKMMCNILNDRTLYEDQQLLRGAVFHLHMNVFGSNIIFHVSPMFYAKTVLTSFLNSLDSKQVNVTYEVILSVRGVITKYKAELPEIIWDLICEIMSAIVDNIDHYEAINVPTPRLHHLQTSFHENIDIIERIILEEQCLNLANYERIYDLIERVAESRPEQSVINLIEYRSSKVTPTRPEWLQLLYDFVRRFYKMSNPKIRIKLIDCLKRIMDLNRACYEEEILERVVIPHFGQIMDERDVQVKVAVTEALVEFAKNCDSKRCGDILNILEKIINFPFEQSSTSDLSNSSSGVALNISGELKPRQITIKTEEEIEHIITAVKGLIDIFVIKLHRLPSCHAIRIFNILVGHLEFHYERPKVFDQINIVRYEIYYWMLKARANANYQIGYPDPENNGIIKYSNYLGIDTNISHPRHSVPAQPTPNDLVATNNFTTLSIRRACKIIVKCLECDTDLKIFQLVMKELPKVLKNKALIQGNDIEALAVALIKTYSEGNKIFRLSSEEFLILVLPAVAALVVHHQYIQPARQSMIISLLTPQNFFSGIANICINTLTTVILEMPEALMRTLPNILLTMSKMSDTTMIALPVLEFLSILSRLSNHLFANFIPVQYMYVFAISLPFTKPFRFDHYTVSLAHHVIAAWFLKCKLELRKNTVSYIISSLQANVKMLFDDINKLNEDSSNRKRSTSLTERGSRNSNLTTRNDSDMRPLMNDSFKTFHVELAETCIDFLARHTFSPCSALPKRLPAVEYLLRDGPSQTWLVGYNLVTITTSGCPSPPNRNGLCDQCAQLSKATSLNSNNGEKTSQPLSPEINATQQHTHQALNERRTKVSLQHSSGNESAGSTDLTSSSSSASTTQRQTSNSSTASLEAISRRGSNPDVANGESGAIGSNTSLLGNTLSTTSPSLSIPSPSTQSVVQQPVCLRSCTGWAEILIRRATGNISWIMRIQNPISNDCFGHEMPFGHMVSLFLPTAQGGIFGPNFFNNENDQNLANINNCNKEETNELLVPPSQANSDKFDSSKESLTSIVANEENRRRIAVKARPLQRQEEISSVSSTTAAIDIPKTITSKRKEALSGSVSDGEVDDENLPFDDGQSRARNPVRRVNSSPEMSSSWRQTLLAGKPAPLSQETSINDNEEPNAQALQQILQKKKSVQYSTKDMRVSCEAIPEEKAGSTPPQNLGNNLKNADTTAPNKEASIEIKFLTTSTTTPSNSLPPKQHSADDVNSNTVATNINPISVQQSTSSSSLKSSQHLEKFVATKPPFSQTPAPLSPRLDKHHNLKANIFTSPTSPAGLTKSNSGGGAGGSVTTSPLMGNGGNNNNNEYNNVGGDVMRGRSKTISVVREVNNGKARPPTTTNFRSYTSTKPPVNSKLCMNPSFVFMQLYNTGQLQVTDTPIKVPQDQIGKLNLLDLAPPYETHKIGVLYVGQGQCNNVIEILRNSYGSTRYIEFLRNIGTLVSVKDAGQNNLFLCLDTNGADGKFTYVWKDDIVQVTFHVATLMPTNLKKDPNCIEKKKHIGNDYVNIIYNESGEEYNLSTISGQFNFACVIVEPLETNTNRVYVKARPEISSFVCHPEPKIVSDRSAPLLARQLALHANLASHVYQSLQKKNPYGSNWLERLRIIKRLRAKLLENQMKQNQSGFGSSNVHPEMDSNASDLFRRPNISRDFTKYT